MSAWVGLAVDRAERHPDPAERQAADEFVALLTPVVKAFFTDVGFEVANLGVQVFGGDDEVPGQHPPVRVVVFQGLLSRFLRL